MRKPITKESLDPYVNDTFEIRFDNNDTVALTLRESTDRSDSDHELFWFIFDGPLDKPLPQKTYHLHHHQAGVLDLFLVPVMSGRQDSLSYQALFNRFKIKDECGR